MENLKQTLSKIDGGKILDVGTGRGEFINLLKEFLKSYEEITGIDSYVRAVDYCKEHFKDDKIHFLLMDGAKLEFPDNTFDMVCLSNSLHHLNNQDEILQEMVRVLKPNGLLVINEMICDVALNEQLSHVKLHHFSASIDRLLGTCHNETYSKAKIKSIINTLNLKDTEVIEYNFPNDNPKDIETINYLSDICDKTLARIKDHAEFDKYKAECDKVKEWVSKYGYSSATELLVIGRK